MNTDIELRNHLLVEFLRYNLSPLSINEERHHVNEVDEIIQYFCKLFDDQVYEAIATKSSTKKTYTGQIPLKTYFKNYNIELTIEYKKGGTPTYDGGFNSVKSIKENDGGWYCDFYCRAKIIAPTMFEVNRLLNFVFAHELTHGWNLLEYAREHNQHPYYSNIVNGQKYTNIKIGMGIGSKNEKLMSTLLYRLNRMERNAIIAQIRNELKMKKLGGLSFDEFYKLVYETNAYTKDFKGIENTIGYLNNLKDKNIQNDLIKIFNTIMDKQLTTFNQLIKHLNGRWLKWKKSFLMKASKIAYDVYYEDGENFWMDWGMMGRD